MRVHPWPTLIAVLCCACSPLTRYRQSLLVPAAAPTTVVGAPIPRGQLGVAGHVSGVWVRDWITDEENLTGYFPKEGDPGVFMSPVSVGGHLRWGLTDFMELGASFDYASGSWARRSSVGVLPLADNASLLSVGPALTGGYMFGTVGFGSTIEVAWTQLPYAQYEYVGPGSWEDYYVIGDAAELYERQDAGVCNPLRVRWTNAMQVRHKAFDSAFGFTLANQITNVGFSDTQKPVYKAGPVSVIPVVDLGFSVPGVHVGVQGWYAAAAAGATNDLYNGLGGRLVMEYRTPGKDRE
jgi:hypothetical protein